MNIPKKAKRVFHGIIFDVYQWKQKMFDDTTATFEMLRRKASVDVIAVMDDGRIMTIFQEQPARAPYPALPGGVIDPGETPLEAAKRELLEETGYVAEKFEFVKEYNDVFKMDFPCHLFIARECKKIQEQNLDSGEKIEIKILNFEEFLSLCRNPLFAAPLGFKYEMYETLLDPAKKEEFKKRITIS